MPRAHINATKCVEYLRSMEIDISNELRKAWRATEEAVRERRRIERRELRRSCGHFQTRICKVYEGAEGWNVRVCKICRREVSRAPIRTPPPRRRKTA